MFLTYPCWNTPLIKLEKESKEFGCKIYAKLELVNPTGSHKDRESVMVILNMKKKGYNKLACASSGNAAVSFSAYAYMVGFEAHIFIGSDIPNEKINLIKIFHPVIHRVKGNYLTAVK
ncbi:MAG: PLP-dependent lyase/thiolase, partial [Candidatus Bathyarchaeia archaeon]